MNKWIEESIEIANAPGYLDRLYQIYPVRIGHRRIIPARVREELKLLYDRATSNNFQDKLSLVKALLELDKFPVEEPYAAFLRKKDFFLDYNPQTVKRVAQRVLSMEFKEIIDAVEEPKAVNRRMGSLFPEWLKTLGYPLLSPPEFEKYDGRGVVLLKGSNGNRKDYANRVLGCDLDKGPDLLARVDTNHVIGEAKFLTDYGGHQDRQFEDALALLRGREGEAIRIAILDGVVWIKGRTKMYRTVRQLRKPALTGLLLQDFLEGLMSSL